MALGDELLESLRHWALRDPARIQASPQLIDFAFVEFRCCQLHGFGCRRLEFTANALEIMLRFR